METLLEYIDADIPLNEDRDRHLRSKTVNLTPIMNSLVETSQRIINDVQKKDLKSPENYRWSLFEELGIPPRSHIKRTDENILFTIQSFLSKSIVIPKSKLYVLDSQIENLWLTINKDLLPFPNTSSHYAYKIHLVCKPEYIVYTFFKLLTLETVIKYKIQTKLNLDSRAHLPSSVNTELINDSVNGGASPSIVIYAGGNRELALLLIRHVLELFRHDADIIGGMERMDSPYSIPTFNVRLNSLMAYASGDRGTKLDLRMANAGRQEYKPTYPKGSFKIPNWTIAMRESCTKETAEAINAKSLLFFGIPLCAEDGSVLPDPDPCGICYMTSPGQEPMISPEEIFAPAPAPAPVAAAPVAACGGAGCKSPRRGGGSRRGYTRRRNYQRRKCSKKRRYVG